MRPYCRYCSAEQHTVRFVEVGSIVECYNCGKRMPYSDLFTKSIFMENMDKTNAIELAGIRRVSEMYTRLNDDDKEIIYDLILRMLGEKQEHN